MVSINILVPLKTFSPCNYPPLIQQLSSNIFMMIKCWRIRMWFALIISYKNNRLVSMCKKICLYPLQNSVNSAFNFASSDYKVSQWCEESGLAPSIKEWKSRSEQACHNCDWSNARILLPHRFMSKKIPHCDCCSIQ